MAGIQCCRFVHLRRRGIVHPRLIPGWKTKESSAIVALMKYPRSPYEKVGKRRFGP